MWLDTVAPLLPGEAGRKTFLHQHQIPELEKAGVMGAECCLLFCHDTDLGDQAGPRPGEQSCPMQPPLLPEDHNPKSPKYEISGPQEPRGEIPRL